MGLLKLLTADPLAFALVAIPLLFSVIIHEVAHGWVAYRMGDPTAKWSGRLTLNPLSHLDPIGTLMLFFWQALDGQNRFQSISTTSRTSGRAFSSSLQPEFSQISSSPFSLCCLSGSSPHLPRELPPTSSTRCARWWPTSTSRWPPLT